MQKANRELIKFKGSSKAIHLDSLVYCKHINIILCFPSKQRKCNSLLESPKR